MGLRKFFYFFILLFSLPVVVAQRYVGSNFRGSSFIDSIVNNEFIRLALIFVLFYMVLFYALQKAFKGQRGTAAGISVVLALLITFTVVRRNLFYDFVGEGFGTWILFFVFVIAAIFFD